MTSRVGIYRTSISPRNQTSLLPFGTPDIRWKHVSADSRLPDYLHGPATLPPKNPVPITVTSLEDSTKPATAMVTIESTAKIGGGEEGPSRKKRGRRK